MPSSDLCHKAFEDAVSAFKKDINDRAMLAEILQTTTIDEVWKALDNVQRQQGSSGHLRHLGRFSSFIDRIEDYAKAIEIFVSAKSDILALVYGPIRLIIQFSHQLISSMDVIAETIVNIAEVLPHYADMVNIFGSDDGVRNTLVLFYRDILDFYSITLSFYKLNRWRLVKESIWSTYKGKIEIVVKDIRRHSNQMSRVITFEHIKEEHEARVQALAHFEQAAQFQDEQKFQALKTRVGPITYEMELNRLRTRFCEGTARWLIKDKSFKEWLDISNRLTPLLWLRGNPGSGKTFMAGAVVDEARHLHDTLYIFASHTYHRDTTALSIFQSLIFQIAFGNGQLQSILVEVDERELLSNTKSAAELFENLIKCSGPTFIVIDGLDEVEEFERRTFLGYLTEIPGRCENLKLFISSRPEDDIEKLLRKSCKTIRLDKKNSGSIQLYVEKRLINFLKNFGGDEETNRDIKSLLSPLAADAEGLFLYARIIMDRIEMLSSVDEMRREFKVLPSDLNSLYHRMLCRIQELDQVIRHKAVKILGWIGCTPTPLTALEMEQALLVEEGNEAPSVTGRIPFVQICGPIIEINAEKLQFVHFTVKEYIFSREIKHSIDMLEANHDLAIVCLRYISSEVFQLGLAEAGIEKNILRGRYRLQDFAFKRWLSIVRPFVLRAETLQKYPQLLQSLEALVLQRKNVGYEVVAESEQLPLFDSLKSTFPRIYQTLQTLLQFQQNEGQGDWKYDNGKNWVNLDPLTLSEMAVQIYKVFELVICPKNKHYDDGDRTCCCNLLKRHYGTRMLKCPFLTCPFNTQGFLCHKDREEHLEGHSRPWKCADPQCPFATIGFNSSKSCNQHWSKHLRRKALDSSQYRNIDVEELHALLFEAIKQGDVELLQQLLSNPKFVELEKAKQVATDATIFAAKLGSRPMVELLKPHCSISSEDYTNSGLSFIAAVNLSENLDLIKWTLLEILADNLFDARDTLYTSLVKCILRTDNTEIYKFWEDFLFIPDNRPDKRSRYQRFKNVLPNYRKTAILFAEPGFQAVKGNEAMEFRLVQTWKRVADAGYLNGDTVYSLALIHLAKSSCSVTLGRELVRLGADVNYPANSSSAQSGMTALHVATAKTDNQSVRFTLFLLTNNADPSIGYGSRTPDLEVLVKNIAKLLDVPWQRLMKTVEKTDCDEVIEISSDSD